MTWGRVQRVAQMRLPQMQDKQRKTEENMFKDFWIEINWKLPNCTHTSAPDAEHIFCEPIPIREECMCDGNTLWQGAQLRQWAENSWVERLKWIEERLGHVTQLALVKYRLWCHLHLLNRLFLQCALWAFLDELPRSQLDAICNDTWAVRMCKDHNNALLANYLYIFNY